MTSRTYWDEDLKSINSKYNLSFSNSYAEYVQTFQTVYSKLNAKLQEIEPAISLHRKEHYSGSIHDATHGSVLKTCKLNLYLYLDITNHVEDCALEQDDGEVILKRNQQPSDTLDKWTNGNCLSQEKYFSWVESVLYRALNAIRGYSDATIGVLRKDPPAFHFSVEKNGKTFIIKVIPALVAQNEVQNVVQKDSCFALVHRNYYSGKSKVLDVSEYRWRASYPINEDDDLFNNDHMKITMRYIKLIRDSYELSYISSYMIKMMFITVNKQEGCSFWRQSLTSLLKHMVQYFYERIVDRNIPDAWHPGYNMLNEVEIDVNQLKDCENKLRSIIKRLEDPDDDVEEIIFHRTSYEQKNSVQTTSSNNGGNWMLLGGLIGVGAIVGAAMAVNSRNRRNNQ